jgi:hypothetical protein
MSARIVRTSRHSYRVIREPEPIEQPVQRPKQECPTHKALVSEHENIVERLGRTNELSITPETYQKLAKLDLSEIEKISSNKCFKCDGFGSCQR